MKEHLNPGEFMFPFMKNLKADDLDLSQIRSFLGRQNSAVLMSVDISLRSFAQTHSQAFLPPGYLGGTSSSNSSPHPQDVIVYVHP